VTAAELWPVLALTLGVAAAATVLCLVPGAAVAWVLSRPGWRGRAALDTLVNLPMVLPPTAIGLVLLLLLGRNGPLGGFLHERLGIVVAFTPLAAVIASTVVAFPLYVRAVRTALEEVDPRLVGLARSLGATPRDAFVSVELPLAWRGIFAGAALAFARALGEFGATILVAGNIPGRTQTLALAIFQEIQVGNDRAALALAGVAALLAFACLFAAERLGERRRARLDDELRDGDAERRR
jgi:molybdate transport system permease protein